MASEKLFEGKIRAFLRMRSASWHVKYWGGGLHTTSGVPDILACVQGVFLAVEVKADHGRPSMLQLKQLESIHRSCGRAVLLYPKDFDGFKKWVSHGCAMDGWYQDNIRLQKTWMETLDEN